jgi:hypothetical protein
MPIKVFRIVGFRGGYSGIMGGVFFHWGVWCIGGVIKGGGVAKEGYGKSVKGWYKGKFPFSRQKGKGGGHFFSKGERKF